MKQQTTFNSPSGTQKIFGVSQQSKSYYGKRNKTVTDDVIIDPKFEQKDKKSLIQTKNGKVVRAQSTIPATLDDPRISEPLKYEQTLSVKFNYELNLYEGLPKAWRELLEIPPQS